MSSSGGKSREEAFWEGYRQVVLRAGVEEGLAVWYRRHVEGFIRFMKRRRLREAKVGDVSDYLLRMHRREDTAIWQVRQADRALRLLYQMVLKLEWAAEWCVPLPLEEVAEAVPSAELGRKTVFAEWGLWEGSLERMVKAMRYLHYSYRTEQTYVEWAVRFVRTVREREPSGVGAVRRQHEADVAAGHGEVDLPAGLARKWPKAGSEWAWHRVFPSERLSVDPRSGRRTREERRTSNAQRSTLNVEHPTLNAERSTMAQVQAE